MTKAANTKPVKLSEETENLLAELKVTLLDYSISENEWDRKHVDRQLVERRWQMSAVMH